MLKCGISECTHCKMHKFKNLLILNSHYIYKLVQGIGHDVDVEIRTNLFGHIFIIIFEILIIIISNVC